MLIPRPYADLSNEKFCRRGSDLGPNKPPRRFDGDSGVRLTGPEVMSLIPQQSFEEEFSSHFMNMRTQTGKLHDLSKVTQQIRGCGEGLQSLVLPIEPPAS